VARLLLALPLPERWKLRIESNNENKVTVSHKPLNFGLKLFIEYVHKKSMKVVCPASEISRARNSFNE